MKQKKITSPKTETLIVGIDWADQEHAICIATALSKEIHLLCYF